MANTNPRDTIENRRAPPSQPGRWGAPSGTASALTIALVVFIGASILGYLYAGGALGTSRAELTGFMDSVGSSVRQAGWLGIVAIIAAYALGVIVAAPSSLMTLAVTLIYGLWAIPIAWAGAFVGLTVAFALSRTVLSKHVQWFCQRYPFTRGMEAAFQNRGFWLVLLMRQSPVIPFSAQNYLFGMLGTRIPDYLIGSAIGLIPGTVAKVIVFENARTAIDTGPDGSTLAMTALGVAATILVMCILARAVRAELRKASVTSIAA